MFCTKCRMLIPEGSTTCMWCGAAVQSRTNADNSTQSRHQQNKGNFNEWFNQNAQQYNQQHPRTQKAKWQKKPVGKVLSGVMAVFIGLSLIGAFAQDDSIAKSINSTATNYNATDTSTDIFDINGNSNVNSAGSNNSFNNYESSQTVTASNKEAITYERFASHLFLNSKNKGGCQTLTGDVQLVMILVNETNSSWSQTDIDNFRRVQQEATKKMIKEASNYGSKLNVKIDYMQCKVSNELTMEGGYYDWMQTALEASSLPNKDSMVTYLKSKYDVKEAAVFFCVNRAGRSFSLPSTSDSENVFECGFLYEGHGDYRHELYHLFGAKDFYFPSEVKTLSEKYFPNSIMLGSGDVYADELTAYLIGWTNNISNQTNSFLESSSNITQSDIDKEREKNIFTGYKSDRYGEGTYTGYFLDGVPNGQGRIAWDDGDIYEGEWEYGQYNGKGTLIWKSGDSYSGEFKNSVGNGQGTLKWTNGNSYSGEWKDWKMHGYGTYTYSDGTGKSGKWGNDNFVG